METSFIMQTVYIEKKEESTAKVLRGKPEDDIFLPEYDKFILPVILWLAWREYHMLPVITVLDTAISKAKNPMQENRLRLPSIS